MRTISCPRCGADVPDSKFCSKCGAALVQAELPQDNAAERASEISFDYHVTGRRVVAALIDIVLMILLFIFVAVVAGDVTTIDEPGDSYFEFITFTSSTNSSDEITAFSTFTLVGWPLLIYYFLALAYFIVMERAAAATLGKMIMGLKVVKVGGAQYGWLPVLIRNVLRIIDGLPTFYLVGFIFVAVTQKNRRLGDLAARTLVVRTPALEPLDLVPGRASDAAIARPPEHRVETVSALPSQPPPPPPPWTDTFSQEPEARRFPWVWAIAGGGVAGAIVVGIVLAVTLSGGDGGGLSEPEQRFNAGVDLQEQGRLEEAIEGYDEAIRLDPQDADSYHKRGFAYFNLGQYERAIEDYDHAIRLDPELAEVYSNRGLAYTNLGQFQRAIEDYDEAIRLDPQLALAYSNRGAAYRKLGEYQRAIENYNEAIRLDPELAEVYSNRGNAYSDLGQHERAIEDFDKAIRLGPQLASAYNNRGLAYYNRGQFQRAIEDYDEAIRLNSQYTDAYIARGNAYANLG